jgi:succinoglycan biosynthesis transport protein ExoP
MAETFDAFRYIGYMRSRLLWILASSGIAVAIALVVSLLMPREYTATARIVIDPPAGADSRAAITVSPIYLESLRTYESFAASDSTFLKALNQFGLRAELGSRPIESLKRRVLKVAIVRNTRILEISATLPDPRKAQALARYLADSTVDMNRTLTSEGDQDFIRSFEQQEQATRARLQEIDDAWTRQLAAEPVSGLQTIIEGDAEARGALEQQIQNTELEIADAAEREKQGGPNMDEMRKQASNARARLAAMRKQRESLDHLSLEREKLLAARVAHRDKLEAERKAATASLTAIEPRLREARGDAGHHGERLRVVDPGIVPERPSAPNIPLNIAAALLLGLILPILYFTLEMSYQEHHARRTVYR